MNELLIWSLIFLGLAQILKVFLDLWATKTMIKALKARDEIHAAEWEKIDTSYAEILELNVLVMDKLRLIQQQLTELQDDVFDVVIKNAGTKKNGKRGPYGPRKPKAIDHKKTPPEN